MYLVKSKFKKILFISTNVRKSAKLENWKFGNFLVIFG